MGYCMYTVVCYAGIIGGDLQYTVQTTECVVCLRIIHQSPTLLLPTYQSPTLLLPTSLQFHCMQCR